MLVETRDGTTARQVLIALATDSAVLARVEPRWDGQLFSSRWENLVAGWCVEHFRKYNAAPKRGLEALFSSWAEKQADDDTKRLVEAFLSGLSTEHIRTPSLASDLVIDRAGELFNRVRARRLTDKVQAELDAGEVTKATDLIAGFNRVELGAGSYEAVFNDRESVRDTFATRDDETLVEFPGDLGRFYQGMLARDALVAFLGSDKSGKSYQLLDVAYRAVLQRRRVAFFEVGDMSSRQVKRRLLARVAGHPYRSPTGNWPCVVRVPRSIRHAKGMDCAEVEYEDVPFDRPLDERAAWEACERLAREKIKSLGEYFRLSVHPNDSIDVAGIKSILHAWESQDGWVPSVVAVDYADILADPPGKMERRDAINKTWKQLRALSQELHCLVVTATQADAEAYGKRTLDRGNFSEDKRKLAHVTGMVGINVAGAEKERGVFRLNWIVLRDGEFHTARCIHVAGCLALASPNVRSTF